jgi:hypothetical protein
LLTFERIVIDLSTIDANVNIAGNQAFATSQLSYSGGMLTTNVHGGDLRILLIGSPLIAGHPLSTGFSPQSMGESGSIWLATPANFAAVPCLLAFPKEFRIRHGCPLRMSLLHVLE